MYNLLLINSENYGKEVYSLSPSSGDKNFVEKIRSRKGFLPVLSHKRVNTEYEKWVLRSTVYLTCEVFYEIPQG